MTTEDDFWNAIEADRQDRLTFAVFADWLDDRGDPRGPVVRMLGVRGRRPCQVGEGETATFRWFDQSALNTFPGINGGDRERLTRTGCVLPHDWYRKLPRAHVRDDWIQSRDFGSERGAFEEVVKAFLKLDPEKQKHTMERELRRAKRRKDK